MATREKIVRGYSPGGWYMTPRIFHRFLSANEVRLLSHMINVADRVQAEKNGGWFRFTVNETERELFMTPGVQRYVIGKLKERGLVKVRIVGQTTQRFVWIDLEKLNAIVETQWAEIDVLSNNPPKGTVEKSTHPPEGEHRKVDDRTIENSMIGPSKTRRSIREESKEESKEERHSMSALKRADASCVSQISNHERNGSPRKKKQPNKFDHRATLELAKIVSSHININCKADMKSWANQFRLMREKDKVPKKDIKLALQWYEKYIGQEYMPECFSAKAFRDKYQSGKIPGAMARTWVQSDVPGGPCGASDAEHLDNVDAVRRALERDEGWSFGQPFNDTMVRNAVKSCGLKSGSVVSLDIQ